jgi:hypothetical protein
VLTRLFDLIGPSGVVISALLTLEGLFKLRRSVRLRARARRHPLEPWRWDQPWQLEMPDERLSLRGLLPQLLGALFLTAFMGGCAAGALIFLSRWSESSTTRFLCVMMALMLAVTIHSAFKFAREDKFAQLRQWRRWRRFGFLRLRLPRIPLALGTHAQVELAVPRALAALPPLQATLRCVRAVQVKTASGGDEPPKTYSSTLHEQHPRVEAGVITLELPPAAPGLSTWIARSEQLYWELRLQSVAPDASLDATFRLPIYTVPELSPPRD